MKTFYMLRHPFGFAMLILFFLIFIPNSIAAPQEPLNHKALSHTQVLFTPKNNSSVGWALSYPNAIRLEQLIKDSLNILNNNLQTTTNTVFVPYWIGSSLSKISEPEDKQAVLAQIDDLVKSEQYDVGMTKSLQALAVWIKNNINQTRLFTPLDYDAIRINKQYNPLINGNYKLVIAERPPEMWVLGAVVKPMTVKWQERHNASAYLDEIKQIKQRNQSIATVIQPDGHIEQHPYAYWNNQHNDIAPGAIIYLTYTDLPSDYSSLNDRIIQLLRNRIL